MSAKGILAFLAAADALTRPCPACDGAGFLEWSDTGAEHGPNCDGYTCREPCPIPVEIRRREPCGSCAGTGRVHVVPEGGR